MDRFQKISLALQSMTFFAAATAAFCLYLLTLPEGERCEWRLTAASVDECLERVYGYSEGTSAASEAAMNAMNEAENAYAAQ